MLGCTGAGKKCELAGLCLTKHSPNFFLGFLQIICLGEKSHPGTFFFSFSFFIFVSEWMCKESCAVLSEEVFGFISVPICKAAMDAEQGVVSHWQAECWSRVDHQNTTIPLLTAVPIGAFLGRGECSSWGGELCPTCFWSARQCPGPLLESDPP